MTKTTPPEIGADTTAESAAESSPAAAAEPAAEFPLSLTEFCTRLSAGDKRVELIAAFHHDESAAGRLSDTESVYRERYAAFAARPA